MLRKERNESMHVWQQYRKTGKSIQKTIIVYSLESCPPRPVYTSAARGITGIVPYFYGGYF